MDGLGQHVEHLEDGLLDLGNELEEGGHHAEGDGTGAQLHGAPDEGNDITEAEAGGNEQTRDHRETGTAVDLALQVLLHIVETARHPVATLQGTQHGIVLHGLLHQHLDDALLTADVERHLPHLTGKELTDHEEDGREQQ